MTTLQGVVVGAEGGVNGNAADNGLVPNMEIQVDDDIEEDECERFSSGSLSSGDDCSDIVVLRHIGISDTNESDELKNLQNKNGNNCGNGTAVLDTVPETVTTQPPDVIMHHNNNIIKRKGSRRNRRKRRSSTTITASIVTDVVDTDGESDNRQTTIVTDVSTIGDELTPLAPSSAGTIKSQILANDTIVPDMDNSITSDPSTTTSSVDNSKTNKGEDSSIDSSTIITANIVKVGGKNNAPTTLQSQQVSVGIILSV